MNQSALTGGGCKTGGWHCWLHRRLRLCWLNRAEGRRMLSQQKRFPTLWDALGLPLANCLWGDDFCTAQQFSSL